MRLYIYVRFNIIILALSLKVSKIWRPKAQKIADIKTPTLIDVRLLGDPLESV